MGRKLMRVALDFAWPLKKIWKGYINPFAKLSQDCVACEKMGYSPRALQFHKEWYGYVEFDPPRSLVCDGPFRWCRNPIAGCVIGMLLGEAIALSSTGILLLAIAAMLAAHIQVVLLEEPLLLRRFGQDYADYAASVPRWTPRRPSLTHPLSQTAPPPNREVSP